MAHSTLSVSEIFYSIQGEGSTMGVPAFFIRLAGCNLMCGGKGTEKDKLLHNGATWRCDTIEVWMKGKTMLFKEIYEKLKKYNFEEKIKKGVHIIFTGGEPLLQQERIEGFLWYLYKFHNIEPIIEIETNGTIIPNNYLLDFVNYWNISPKLNNSGEGLSRRVNIKVIGVLNQERINSIFKFVITKRSDWEEILNEWIIPFNLNYNQIWLMPAAETQEELYKRDKIVAALAIENGVNFSARLQIEIWNQTVGV